MDSVPYGVKSGPTGGLVREDNGHHVFLQKLGAPQDRHMDDVLTGEVRDTAPEGAKAYRFTPTENDMGVVQWYADIVRA